MKPWNNPLCFTVCYICGRKGWNLNGLDAWTGTLFRCSKGCHPEDIKKHVKKQIDKETTNLGD